MHFRSSSEINFRLLYNTTVDVYVASPDHLSIMNLNHLQKKTRLKYRGIAIADTARERPVLTVLLLLDKQRRLTIRVRLKINVEH